MKTAKVVARALAKEPVRTIGMFCLWAIMRVSTAT